MAKGVGRYHRREAQAHLAPLVEQARNVCVGRLSYLWYGPLQNQFPVPEWPRNHYTVPISAIYHQTTHAGAYPASWNAHGAEQGHLLSGAPAPGATGMQMRIRKSARSGILRCGTCICISGLRLGCSTMASCCWAVALGRARLGLVQAPASGLYGAAALTQRQATPTGAVRRASAHCKGGGAS